MQIKFSDLSAFTRAYVEAMLFTECSDGDFDPENGNLLPGEITFDDFAPETVQSIIEDCAAFRLSNRTLLNQCGDDSQNGHDFWLTRNWHGAGFWDRGYDVTIGELITQKAHAFGEVFVYLGEDGKVYIE